MNMVLATPKHLTFPALSPRPQTSTLFWIPKAIPVNGACSGTSLEAEGLGPEVAISRPCLCVPSACEDNSRGGPALAELSEWLAAPKATPRSWRT